jgi:hypothetical protein
VSFLSAVEGNGLAGGQFPEGFVAREVHGVDVGDVG